MRDEKLLVYIEVATLSAVGLILDFLASYFGVAWPNGGSIGIAIVPIIIMAYRRGLLSGLLTGFIIGLLQILYAGSGFLNLFQAFFDYYGAYAAIGLAGLFYPLSKRRYKIVFLVVGIFIGCLVRFIFHTISGVTFWGADIWFSITYNGGYMLPSFILSTIIILIINATQPQLLDPTIDKK